MKLKQLLDESQASDASIARRAGILPQNLHRMKAQDRNALELKDGRWVIENKHTVIIMVDNE
jgi:hypothetical protein